MLSANLKKFWYQNDIPQIVHELDKIKASILYLPHETDYHQDHYKAFQVGKAVSRNNKMTMMAYLTPTSYNYYPNAFKEINLDDKLNLIRCFKTQAERRPDYLVTMKAQHKFFGALIGVEHAEGFIFHRMIL